LIFNGKYNSHTNPMFKYSCITRIENIFEQEAAIFMHKFKNNEQPIIFKDIISQGSNNTRSDSENKHKIDPQLRKGDTIYDIISAWNQSH
jgi:hypothetical protein